jgi:hypothetical protein
MGNFGDDLPWSEVNTEHEGESHNLAVRFYVLTEVAIKGANIWDVMSWAAEVTFCLHGLVFEGMCSFHL